MLSLPARFTLRLRRYPPARSILIRSFTQPTPPRLRPPAAQLAEVEPDYLPPSIELSPSASHQSIHFGRYPGRIAPPLSVATPLPPDVPALPTDPREAIYQNNGVIDSISMLSICLRRPELMPRAYQIFRQILEDAAIGLQRMPDEDTWGRVVEGSALLGQGSTEIAETWRKRAARLVERWEFASPRRERFSKKGLKVYQGFFSGMVRWVGRKDGADCRSQSSLEPIIPYLTNGDISVEDLLDGVKPSDLPLAFDALIEAARANKLTQMEQKVLEIKEWEKDQREKAAQKVVEEIRPVPEVSLPTSPS